MRSSGDICDICDISDNVGVFLAIEQVFVYGGAHAPHHYHRLDC